jgi:S1-C subfamily serine protease
MDKSLLAALVLGSLLWVPQVSPAGNAKAEEKGYVGVRIRMDHDSGEVVIVEVVADGPADKAGLKAADVIIKINEVEAKDLETVIDTVMGLKPGDEATFKIKRDGKEESVKVKVGKRPE